MLPSIEAPDGLAWAVPAPRLARAAAPEGAAAAPEVVIEVDALAERVLDARATRRLVALELADVQVPPLPNSPSPALFYRMLGQREGSIRVELWELGQLHDARVVSTLQGSGHLVARRVALAAAELARGLRQRRLALSRREARERERARAEAMQRAQATLEGPVAVRSAFGVLRGEQLTLLGPSLALELTLRGSSRLDLGARWLGGEEDGGLARVSLLETRVGPAHRFQLGSRLDLDVAPELAAAVVHVSGATSAGGAAGVRQTWTARGGVALRLEPRLSRFARASIGAEGSLFLRDVAAEFPGGRTERYRGFLLGVELAIVLTPP